MDAARPNCDVVNQVKSMQSLQSLQSLLESLTTQQFAVVLSMVDLDCVDWTPTIEELTASIEMFGYSEEDIIDRVTSNNEFIFEDEYQ